MSNQLGLSLLIIEKFFELSHKVETMTTVHVLVRPSVNNYTLVDFQYHFSLKVGLSPSKKFFYLLPWKPFLKKIKNRFYFILKALFVLKIFKFLSWLFGHVEKTTWLER